MATANSTTSPRPENRVFIFLALSRANQNAMPHREQVIATSEREARLMLVGRYVLFFAGRMPVPGAHHE
ncbi:host cell division inhibitor Icd-like protein [Salmonella enterica subsp. enterica serovar Schwarzengrund]|nr:host cell division inhibitor Icd-like protein [Salmonella enterica subsp. enterica serovar Schwarzengrund]EBO4136679.1 host cell division inhibitor Icd-like protein [Salmonella enterica]EAC0560231.1 host cell division inhibitor Icd-like protein [Salmonella enterica subsp. enterica serovar Schwarzengrund]EBR9640724.1 host cell division inhibitor Icd-like protein [Salmonella enterica subsp. enterica serovar Schwarzengrund]EBS1801248.1 host cell division inhibitor Icd-like protein [Salmonella e